MAEFRERHRVMCERFAQATRTQLEMVRANRGAGTDVERFLEERKLVFEYWAELEAGRLARRGALRAFLRGPKWDRAFAFDALVASVSPASARRAVYRSSLRRWATA
jgi:hypothetical protein